MTFKYDQVEAESIRNRLKDVLNERERDIDYNSTPLKFGGRRRRKPATKSYKGYQRPAKYIYEDDVKDSAGQSWEECRRIRPKKSKAMVSAGKRVSAKNPYIQFLKSKEAKALKGKSNYRKRLKSAYRKSIYYRGGKRLKRKVRPSELQVAIPESRKRRERLGPKIEEIRKMIEKSVKEEIRKILESPYSGIRSRGIPGPTIEEVISTEDLPVALPSRIEEPEGKRDFLSIESPRREIPTRTSSNQEIAAYLVNNFEKMKWPSFTSRLGDIIPGINKQTTNMRNRRSNIWSDYKVISGKGYGRGVVGGKYSKCGGKYTNKHRQAIAALKMMGKYRDDY